MALKLTLSVHVFTILQAPSRHFRREHAHESKCTFSHLPTNAQRRDRAIQAWRPLRTTCRNMALRTRTALLLIWRRKKWCLTTEKTPSRDWIRKN